MRTTSEGSRAGLSLVDRRSLWAATLCVPLCASAGLLVAAIPVLPFAAMAGLALAALAFARPYWFLGVGVALLLAQRTVELHVPSQLISASDEAFVLACFLAFPLARLGAGMPLRPLPGHVWLAGFLLLGLVSSYVNEVSWVIALQGAVLIAKGFAFAWATAQLDWPDDAVRRSFQVAAAIVVLLIIGAAANSMVPGPWTDIVLNGQGFGSRFGVSPVTSFFAHPGYFGTVMIMSVLAAVAYQNVFSRNAVTTFIIVGGVAAALLTARRKIIGALVAAYVTLGLRHRPGPTVLLLIFGAPVLLALAWQPLSDVAAYTYREYLVNPDASARVRLTTDSMALANSAFPLGEGFGRFGSASARINYSPLYYQLGYPGVHGLGATEETGIYLTDTFWPAIVGESGWIGTVLFLLALVACIRVFTRLAKRSHWDRFIGLVGIAWSVQLIIESLAGAVFTAVPTFALYFGFVGVAIARDHSPSASSGTVAGEA